MSTREFPFSQVTKLLNACLEGATKVSWEDDGYSVLVYKVGQIIRVDIKPKDAK